MTIDELNKIPVFFIVGMPRSGTTLLRTLLDAHPHVSIPLESKFILYFKKKYKNNQSWDERKILHLLEELYQYPDFAKNVGADRAKLTEQLLSLPSDKLSYSIICKVILMQYPSIFRKGEILVLGDKNPMYTLYLEELWTVFPNAKFIHLLRDYRDVILSHRLKFGVKDLAGLAHTWKFYNQSVEYLQRRKSHLYKMIRYEDLVQEPERMMKEVFDFLNLEYDPNVFRFHETIRSQYGQQNNPAIEFLFPELKEQINKSPIGKWKTGLKAEELALIDYVAGERAARWGYQKESKAARSFFLTSFFAFIRKRINLGLIRFYYDSPMWMRHTSSFLTDKIYRKTGVLTVFNRANYVDEILKERSQNEK